MIVSIPYASIPSIQFFAGGGDFLTSEFAYDYEPYFYVVCLFTVIYTILLTCIVCNVNDLKHRATCIAQNHFFKEPGITVVRFVEV